MALEVFNDSDLDGTLKMIPSSSLILYVTNLRHISVSSLSQVTQVLNFDYFCFYSGFSVVTQSMNWGHTPGIKMPALSFVSYVSMSKFN